MDITFKAGCFVRKSAFCLLVYAWPVAVQAGAWAQPEGQLQTITTTSYYSTDEFTNTQGDSRSQPRYDKYELTPYIEYGLTDCWTLGLNAALQYVASESSFTGQEDTNWGLGDTEIFARRTMWNQGSWVFAIQPLVKLPSVYAEDRLPKSGSDHWDAEMRGLAGYGFSAFGYDHFLNTELAYRKRLGSPSDQWRSDTTIGFSVAPNMQILAQAFATFRVDEPDMARFTQSKEDDYDLLKLQVSGVYRLQDGYALQLGAFQHVWARNSGEGGGALFAVWKQF